MATARMGLKTCLLTMNADAVAQMSCNPAIVGSQGADRREIDALGGVMGRCTTPAASVPHTTLPRVRRCTRPGQCDKKLYQFTMKRGSRSSPV